MSKFFFNDVQVTKEEYDRLVAQEPGAYEAFQSRVQADKVEAAAEVMAPVLPTAPKRSRKAAKMPAPVIPAEPVELQKAAVVEAEPKAKVGKTSVALEIVKRHGKTNKEAAIVAIMSALDVTRANANCYFFNCSKKLGI